MTSSLPDRPPLPLRELPDLPISYYFPSKPSMTFDAPYEALGSVLPASESSTGAVEVGREVAHLLVLLKLAADAGQPVSVDDVAAETGRDHMFVELLARIAMTAGLVDYGFTIRRPWLTEYGRTWVDWLLAEADARSEYMAREDYPRGQLRPA